MVKYDGSDEKHKGKLHNRFFIKISSKFEGIPRDVYRTLLVDLWLLSDRRPQTFGDAMCYHIVSGATTAIYEAQELFVIRGGIRATQGLLNHRGV